MPIYLQIQAQVKHAVAAGALRAGDALPSVRKLASDLRINPNTVARAYLELEREGVIAAVPGGGTFVADGLPGLLKAERVRRFRPLARQAAVEGRQLRLSRDESNRRTVIQVRQGLPTKRAIGRQHRTIRCHGGVDRVVECHELAEDRPGLLQALMAGVVVAKDDRHPLRWPDELGCTRDGEEEALQLMVPEGAGRTAGMLQE